MGAAAALAPSAVQEPRWDVRRTAEPRRTGLFRNPGLDESSGVTASRRHPGILWTLNDSGNEAWIYATDTLGRNHGEFEVMGAQNVDWEAISIGPCGRGDCIYISDTGDNRQDRRSATLYRVPEPTLPGPRPRTRPAEVLEFRYPRGRHDVEAAFVDSAGTTYLITKTGRGVANAFRLPAGAWKARETVTAQEVGRLQIDTGSLGNRVTDAAISPSGTFVAVRTYLAIYLFALTGGGSLAPTGVACDAAGLQLQGEGISWLDDRVLVLTSEGGFGTRGTIVLVECGEPRTAT